MACSTCGTGGCGSAGGCQNKGLCASGSCNKMNAYDWISTLDIDDPTAYEYVEVSFKNGARKEFFKNPNHLATGEAALVEVQGGGYDIGTISLAGDLVRLQMKKKGTNEDKTALAVIRRANERDLEKLENKTELERDSMIKARAIAYTLGLDIKIGDVEYQGDLKKATFFFTANGRVDFRELVRAYAKEFKVKIEMRQIGSRQESARIGGIGSCGRELCCSTWLSDFKSVNTTVARYQNIAINQTKLSGQCGRLKCCLNYELDSYMDALQHFPSHANTIKTQKGNAHLVKTDIFKGLMFYVYEDVSMRGVFHPLDKENVKKILDMNKKGVFPEDLTSFEELKEQEIGYADVTGEIELPNKKKKKKKKPAGKGGNNGGSNAAEASGNEGRQEGHGPRPENRNQRPQLPKQNREGQQSRPNHNGPQHGPRPPRDQESPRSPRDQENPRPPRDQQGPRPPRDQENSRPPIDQQQGNKPQGNRPPQEQQNRPPQENKPAQQPKSEAPPTDNVNPPVLNTEGNTSNGEASNGEAKKNFKKKKFFNKNRNKNNNQ
jgi:cell fate regulator YaaT (PSP1 superfamily)